MATRGKARVFSMRRVSYSLDDPLAGVFLSSGVNFRRDWGFFDACGGAC
jgi:hypothetical protein